MQTEQIPILKADEYPGGIWYYEPHTYQPYRYVLGRVGTHPLVCIGINPSTAQPGALDPTLKSVERLAAANGFDSWIMFNVYPQRATDPNDMDRVPDRALCDENLRWLKAVLAQTEPTMWAAWGTLIEKRDYLPGLMREMVALTREREIPWVTFGRRSKKGHPHHPLYLRSWMNAHPTAKRCVVALDRWLPLIPFVCYPVLLCLLNVRLFRLLGSQRQAALDLTAVIARTVFVPGLTFWGGTILRDRLNLPRPYEQPGFEPLRHKETRGHSFPSRHALSASVLAMVWMYFYPKAGWVMVGITVLICVGRVLTGVHHIRDVVGGAALGFALGFAGMWLL